MSEQPHDGKTRDDHMGGKAPAQWFVRLLGLGAVAGAVAALFGMRHELKRYARIKQM